MPDRIGVFMLAALILVSVPGPVLESSALAFATVKYLGAAYLVYLGVRRLISAEDDGSVERAASPAPLGRVFAQGFLIAVLNPKTALFFVAFLPQFVNPYHGSIRLQIAVLGIILVAIGLCTDTCYALLSGTFGQWLMRCKAFARGRRFAVGGTYLALGAVAAVTRPVRAS